MNKNNKSCVLWTAYGDRNTRVEIYFGEIFERFNTSAHSRGLCAFYQQGFEIDRSSLRGLLARPTSTSSFPCKRESTFTVKIQNNSKEYTCLACPYNRKTILILDNTSYILYTYYGTQVISYILFFRRKG